MSHNTTACPRLTGVHGQHIRGGARPAENVRVHHAGMDCVEGDVRVLVRHELNRLGQGQLGDQVARQADQHARGEDEGAADQGQDARARRRLGQQGLDKEDETLDIGLFGFHAQSVSPGLHLGVRKTNLVGLPVVVHVGFGRGRRVVHVARSLHQDIPALEGAYQLPQGRFLGDVGDNDMHLNVGVALGQSRRRLFHLFFVAARENQALGAGRGERLGSLLGDARTLCC